MFGRTIPLKPNDQFIFTTYINNIYNRWKPKDASNCPSSVVECLFFLTCKTNFLLKAATYPSVLVVAVQSAFKAAYRFCASTLKSASKSAVFTLICVAAVRPALLADIFGFCNDTFPVTCQPFMDGKVTPPL